MIDSGGSFRHEALLYAGEDEFVTRSASFVRDAAEAEEPVLVVVGAQKIDRLREELGGDPPGVLFADMAEVGANPARILPAWRDFVDHHAADGRHFRGIGEPIYPGRGPAELVECQRHESLLNLAFADGPPWWLLCPYDTEALEPAVLDEALRTHPFVWDGEQRESPAYHGLDVASAPFAAPLPEPEETPRELAFDGAGLDAVRRFVVWHAGDAGLPESRVSQLVLAVHELAANSVRHGGGTGTLRVWRESDAFVCEVSDAGRIEDPLVGRVEPSDNGHSGRGLWLANRLCDLVQVRTFPSGSVVRLHLRAG